VINYREGFGHLLLLEISDPWDAQNTIRTSLNRDPVDGINTQSQFGGF
jgi:hypothetical protein